MPDPTPNFVDLGIAPEARDRLLPHVDSFEKWELLRFFHDNPGLEATVEELARYMGRDETELKPAAQSLVGAGIFRRFESPYGYTYCLTEDEQLQPLVGHLVQSFARDRLVRLAISSHILRARRDAWRLQLAAR